ncbi:class A beta-lactamase [Asticcacaulis sp.]|uniref:class A beta-lactamase n=1 Tax=Asticcacaulis sp. TaxID=1872648 RepID=UPI002CD24F0C|nr:class A beta-lactamase [Asticcacaulis sp.]HTM81856.1 class A beta-lactamase [Asticcacaulis sp.]
MVTTVALAGSLAGCSEKVTQALGFAQRMIEIQKRHGGRVGVSALTGTSTANAEANGSLSIQSTERFAMCSTFKWVLAAAILQQVGQGKLKVTDLVKYGKKDLLEYAPTTTANVARGQMTIGALCAAAVSLSDNTAANLLLPLIGGPAGLTAFVRGLGDTVTRFDRTEPSLNTNIDGDEKDTTTPEAMSTLLRTVFTGTVLKPESLTLLKDWMVATTTGNARIRAGVPQGAVVAHKTGTGEHNATNDVGVVWLPNKPPVFLSIYTSGGTLDADGRNSVIADVTKLVFDTLSFVETLDKAASA